MKIQHLFYALAAMSLFAIGSLMFSIPSSTAVADDAEKAEASAEPEAVEADMHEFMEYVFQPTYKRLKASMAAEPDNAGWKSIKSDSLILAEGGNLLLFRGGDEDRDEWNKHSTDVRQLGGQMYRAAQKKDYAAASKSYKAMLTSCNACHTTFAGGEHQLSP